MLAATKSLFAAAARRVVSAAFVPTFDAVGPGAVSGTSQLALTLDPAASLLLAVVSAEAYTAVPNWTVGVGGVSPGTVSLTELVRSYVGLDGFYNWGWALYGLLNPPTGVQNLYLTGNGAGSFNAWSYENVGSLGTAVQVTGTGQSAAHTVSAATGQVVTQVFQASDGIDTLITNYAVGGNPATPRWNYAASPLYPILIGDAPGAASMAFTATVPAAARDWSSVAVPLIPSRPITFDAIGAGSTNGATNPASWPHNIVDNGCVLLALHVITTGGGPTGLTAEIGGATPGTGTAMTEIYHSSYDGPVFNTYATIYLWKLVNGPSGSQVVRILGSNWATLSGFTANSVSYSGVSNVGTPVAVGGGGNASVTASSWLGRMVANVFANTDLGHAADSGFTGYNNTQRIYQTMGGFQPLLMGDAPGASTVTFTANGASDCPWVGLAVPLL